MRNYFIKVKKYLKTGYRRSLIARHGFWFIDIPRTSSSSIRSELGKCFGKAYGKTNVIEREYVTPQIIRDHIPAKKMCALLGRRTWDRIFTFTIVRNPWDRTFSMYNYRKKIGDIPAEWSFSDYVHELGNDCSDSAYFRYYGYRYGAADYVLDSNGEVIVDFIARYENRQDDLELIAKRIKCDALGSLCIQAATPKDHHYTHFYNNETREIIQRLYIKDIEMFDYEFRS